MKKTILIIDAGHGSISPTTGEYLTAPNIGKKTLHNDGNYHGGGWFYEGLFNRQSAADFMRQAAGKFHCIPIYHQWDDTSLGHRVELANNIARAMGNDNVFLLSFHSNSNSATTAPQNKAYGYTLHTYALKGRTANIAKAIAPKLNWKFGQFGSLRPSIWPLHFQKVVDITAKTTMPTIILEQGFFDNPKDAKLLLHPEVIEGLNKTLLEELSKVLW